MVVHHRNKDGKKREPPPQIVKTSSEKEKNDIKAKPAETKPSIFEKFWFLKYIVLIILAPAFLNHAALSRETKELQPPSGVLYDVGWGQKLYMGCHGKGAPTIILDAPTGMASDAWALIAPKLAKITKVCVYDRAGLGFSERPFINHTQPEENEKGNTRRGTPSTTERMVEDFHRLFTAASDQPRPFILVGAELGAVNMRFYAQLFEGEVVGLVLVNPLVEGMFDKNEETWVKHWQSRFVSTLQTLQFTAAIGISRVALIFGLMKTQINSKLVDAGVHARQKHLMCKPAHLSSAVDEFYFANDSLSQMRVLRRIKPFPRSVGVSIVSSSIYSTKPDNEELNKVWKFSQDHLRQVIHPSSENVQLSGGVDSALFNHASTIAQVIERRVNKWRKGQQHAAKQ